MSVVISSRDKQLCSFFSVRVTSHSRYGGVIILVGLSDDTVFRLIMREGVEGVVGG
jgi:hypothetical protein